MTDLIFASHADRINTLRKMFKFQQGQRGCVVVCAECKRTFWADRERCAQIFEMMLEILTHANQHPSF